MDLEQEDLRQAQEVGQLFISQTNILIEADGRRKEPWSYFLQSYPKTFSFQTVKLQAGLVEKIQGDLLPLNFDALNTHLAMELETGVSFNQQATNITYLCI